MCVGLDLKDAFFHIPMRPEFKKFLRLDGKENFTNGRFYPLAEKCSLRILTFMVKPILIFLGCKNISLTSFMDNFTNKAKCDCKVIFEIHVIVLVLMCCRWSINWVKTYMDPTWILIHLGFLGHLGGDYCLARRQNYPSGDIGQEALRGRVHHSGGT